MPTPVGYDNTTFFSGDDKDNGWGGGVGLGYNFQFDNVVLGGILDWTWLDVGKTRHFTGCCGPDSVTSDLSSVGTLRAVLGFAGERFMPYVTAGWAWGDANHTFNSSAGNGHRISLDSSDGWAWGGGLNFMVGERTAINVELLYVDLGDDAGHHADDWPSEAAARVKSHATIGRVGVVFRF